jgi:hypothetical protein
MYTLVLIVGFFSVIALIGYQLKIERENGKIRNASRNPIATLIDPPTTQFGRMTKLFFILVIPIAGLICLLVLTRDDLAKYNKAREVAKPEQSKTEELWSSYGEYKFVLRARRELGWEGSRNDEFLKRAYASENPERMLQALKESQFHLSQSIRRASGL